MMTRNVKKCPYCHNEIGKTHYALIDNQFYTNDEYIEGTVDINSNDKTLVLAIGDCYEDYSYEIKINYCPPSTYWAIVDFNFITIILVTN